MNDAKYKTFNNIRHEIWICFFLVLITLGWLWFLGTLIPVIGLVQVGAQTMADRYTYVPLIGIFIIISWGLSDLVNQNLIKKGRKALIAAVILGVLMTVTWKQLGYWKNSVTLFERALEVTENNYVAHNN